MRAVGQVVGAGAAGLTVSWFARSTFGHDTAYVATSPIAELIASFGFMLVALGVAHRRDASVPIALGAFATASVWMTGCGTVGNPLLSLTVLFAAMAGHPSSSEVAHTGGADVVGSALAVLVGLYLFPRVREAASSLLFVPDTDWAP